MPNQPQLTTDFLAQLVGQVYPHQQELIELKTTDLIQVAQAKLILNGYKGKPLHVPTIKYDLKGTTAGQAVYYESNKATELRLNLVAISEHWDYMFNQTLPHEIAHAVVYQVWGLKAKGHGSQWKMVCHWFGIKPERTHDMPLAKVRRRNKMERPHVYYCDCPGDNRLHNLTDIRHRRIVNNQRYYTCTRCGAVLRAREE